MKRNIVFTPTAWEHYLWWLDEDRKKVKRINKLINSICQDGLMNGLGKPEPLKYRSGYSRRITDEHRLVYDIDKNDNLIIYAAKYHYEED